MRRTQPRTETLSCDGSPPEPVVISPIQETVFEKQRGLSEVETTHGLCQVHIIDLAQPLMESRLSVLQAIAALEISIDFLKLTPSGMSFVVPQDRSVELEAKFKELGISYNARQDRSVVSVFAVNMRDEEGLVAEIVKNAIGVGAQIDHIGDGHDRLLLVVNRDHAGLIVDHFRQSMVRPKGEARVSRPR